MSEIPEDVMKAVQSAWEMAWSKTGSTNAESIKDAIAIAILAERGRCAEIAQAWIDNFSQVEILHMPAREYATDAVADILDLITDPLLTPSEADLTP